MLGWIKLKHPGEGDITYELRDGAAGATVASAYRGGNRWYPWSWSLAKGVRADLPSHRRSGTSTSLELAKDAAETTLGAWPAENVAPDPGPGVIEAGPPEYRLEEVVDPEPEAAVVFALIDDEARATRIAGALIRWSINFRYEYVGDHHFELLATDGATLPDEDVVRHFRLLVETA